MGVGASLALLQRINELIINYYRRFHPTCMYMHNLNHVLYSVQYMQLTPCVVKLGGEFEEILVKGYTRVTQIGDEGPEPDVVYVS